MTNKIPILLIVLTALGSCETKNPSSEKRIEHYGSVYEVPHVDFEVPQGMALRPVFDVNRQYDNRDKTNPLIESAARFLNLHLDHGLDPDQLDAALVVHGSAVFDLLNTAAYQAKYGQANPNEALVSALKKAGVRIVICGQSAAYHKVLKKDVLPEVEFAYSAMTALTVLQELGFKPINF